MYTKTINKEDTMSKAQVKKLGKKVSIENFNLEALQKTANRAIKEIIGVDAGLVFAVKEDDKYDVVTFESNNLVEGVVPRMFKSLHLVSWGSFIDENNNLFIKINYRYSHFDGGSNGFGVADLIINVAGNIVEVRNKIPLAPLSLDLG